MTFVFQKVLLCARRVYSRPSTRLFRADSDIVGHRDEHVPGGICRRMAGIRPSGMKQESEDRGLVEGRVIGI